MSTDNNEQEIVNSHPHSHTNATHETTHNATTHATHGHKKTAWKWFVQAFWAFLQDIEKLGDEYLVEKAPFTLPADIKDFIVKASPYITIISLIISLPAIIALLGFGTVFAAVLPAAGIILVLTMGLTAVSFVLQAMAIKPLFARASLGWKYSFYASLLSFLSAVLHGSIGGAIIGGLIGLYILFQVKSYYK